MISAKVHVATITTITKLQRFVILAITRALIAPKGMILIFVPHVKLV